MKKITFPVNLYSILYFYTLRIYFKERIRYNKRKSQREYKMMIRHVVCFKLKDPTPENCEQAAKILRSMEGNVEMLRDIRVGIDFLHSERSYDLILEVSLDNAEALEAYQNHPYHVQVVKKHMHAVRESSVAVDYVLP